MLVLGYPGPPADYRDSKWSDELIIQCELRDPPSQAPCIDIHLVLGALNLACGYWYLTIPRSASART